MNKRTVTVATLLAVAVLGVTAGAGLSARPASDCGAHWGAQHTGFDNLSGSHEQHLRHLLGRLDLTQPQRDQVFTIMHEKRPLVREQMNALRAGRQALKDLVMTANYDPEQVRKLAEAQAEIGVEFMMMRAATFNQVYGLLTPEQREKLAQWKNDRRPRFAW